MKKGANKVLIIILIVIAILAIAGGVFAYLYFFTDVFKTEQELFAKYLVQDIDDIGKTIKLEKLSAIGENLKQSKYEQNTTISYTGAEDAEPNTTVTIDTQNDTINQKYYGIVGLSFKDLDNTLQVEYMKDQDIYSLRFTNVIKQFLSVENNELKTLAENFGISEDIINEIPDQIDFEQYSLEELKFTDEEKNAEIDKYAQVLYNNISEEKYTKTRGAVITLSGKTIKTNAYTLTLSNNDFKDLTLKLLDTLEQDDIILSKLQALDDKLYEYNLDYYVADKFQDAIEDIKAEIEQEDLNAEDETADIQDNIIFTVYEQNGKTVRIKIERGLENISIDTVKDETQNQINVAFNSIDAYNTQTSVAINFIKENENKLKIQNNNIIDGVELTGNEISIEVAEGENNISTNITLDNASGQIAFTNIISVVDEIEWEMVLNNNNNILLNGVPKQNIQSVYNLFNVLQEKITQQYVEPIETHMQKILEQFLSLVINQATQNPESLPNIDDTYIAQFNAQFEVYEGTNRATTDVNALLQTVYAHNVKETENEAPRCVIVSGDVTLSADATEAKSVTGEDTYNIECKKDEEGLTSEIVVTKNTDE